MEVGDCNAGEWLCTSDDDPIILAKSIDFMAHEFCYNLSRKWTVLIRVLDFESFLDRKSHDPFEARV